MKQEEIEKNLQFLDGRGSDDEYRAIRNLSALGLELPHVLLLKYRESKKWGERVSCVYHASKYAVESKVAFKLAVEALEDKSKKVRYEACLLLVIAQNPDGIVPLQKLLNNKDSASDAAAAIDAIKCRNVNYFADRDHSGMVTLNVKQFRS